MLVCTCFVGCTEQSQKKYYLYCSLNDADAGTQILTVEQAQESARDIIIDLGLGYTEYVTYGAYVENGEVKGSDTLIYLLFFVDHNQAQSLATELKQQLNLASILLEEVQCSYDFVE